LLQSGLGDHAGWLLGFAAVAAVAILVLSRVRGRDPRTGWVLAVGGALLVPAIVFSFAQGIFHPYYVSFLAPFTAMLIGAGVGEALRGGRTARIAAPAAIVAGIITELAVLGTLSGQLSWAKPLVIVVGGLSAVLLAVRLSPRLRAAAMAVALAALLAAPATWAAETIGHATAATFPAGGPASAQNGFGGPGGGRGSASGGRGSGFGGRGSGFGGRGSGFGAPPAGGVAGSAGGGVQGLFTNPSSTGSSGVQRPSGTGGFGGGAGFGGPGGMFGGDSTSLTAAENYAKAHGGGTIGVESQSTASAAILANDGDVAGLGGFSGRESTISPQWLAMEVQSGKLRWIVADTAAHGFGGGFGGAGGDSRQGSATALAIAEKVGTKVTFTSNGTTVTMYDLHGKASAILAAADQS
jgi:hypothetical protein